MLIYSFVGATLAKSYGSTHMAGLPLTRPLKSLPLLIFSPSLAPQDNFSATSDGGDFRVILERISKISIPLGGPGFIIEILATVSEEAYSERTTSESITRKSPPD